MRVLVVHNAYRQPGGEDVVVAAEARLLVQGGHDVLVHEVENPPGGLEAALGLARSPWSRAAAAEVAAIAERFDPDVVHVHNTWYALTPSILWGLRRHRAARVATLHNYRLHCVNAVLFRDGRRCTECLGHVPWRGVVHRCYRESALASAAVASTTVVHRALRTWATQVEALVVPTQLARELLVRGGLAGERLIVKPHFAADPGARPAPPSASTTVLYAGRFSRDKGLAALVDAWSAAAPDHLELRLVGGGELEERLRASGPRVRVDAWMPRDELTAAMLRARAVVVPTPLFETFGLTAAEAMAAGAPVATVSGSAIEEVLGAGGPPAVAHPDDVDGWRDALGRLADDAAVDAWGAAGRQRFVARYSEERALEQLLEVYRAARRRRAA